MYGEDPTISMHQVAKELRVQDLARVTRQTIASAIKQLGMRSYVRRVRALISAKAKVKRVERSTELQQWLKENPNTVVCLCSKFIHMGQTK